MTSPRRSRTEALQADAADPDACAWVSANAGTGKTHVLSRRVLRLLLAGTAPERILCLTYTKAAAAEMANRVFDELARWVTLADEELATSLGSSWDATPRRRRESARARSLPARSRRPAGSRCRPSMRSASGCSSASRSRPVCRQGFTILDETEGCALQRAAIDAMHAATSETESALGEALRLVIAYAAEDRFDAVLGEALRERRWIEWCLRLGIDGNDDYAAAEAFYRKALGVRPREPSSPREGTRRGPR